MQVINKSGVSGMDDRWTAVKAAGVALAALSIVFDGFDNQALGLAISAISREWAISPKSFTTVSFIGLAGMTVGTAIAGMLGDRLGRRLMMIASVTLFGLFTMSTALAQNMETLIIIRFLTGLGLGGAMPNATALAAELSPVRARPLTVTATIVCVPLGGLLAGVVAAAILPGHGWRTMFVLAGALPLILAIALWLRLPESPRFLAEKQNGADNPANEKADEDRPGFTKLFGAGYARDTLAVWAAFFLCLIAVYATFSWLPATLSGAGFDQKTASLGLASFNFGGVAGAVLAAVVITRIGSRRAMTGLATLGVVVAGIVLINGTGKLTPTTVLIALAALGFTINGVQTTLFALASHIYPARIRSTGVGAALSFGRVGAMASSLAGGFILGGGNTTGYFMVLAVAMAGTVVALLAISNHIPAGGGSSSED
ncbi:MAG: MFS transporter [Novosphingobium sp.]